MKRLHAVAIVLSALLLTAPACGSAAEPPREPAPPASPARVSAPTPTGTPLSGTTPSAALRTRATVVEVIDGDTIKIALADQVYTVRYIGIDAPEVAGPYGSAEWLGPQATEVNRELVGGKVVLLEKDVSETDRYGRLLRYVFLPGGLFVNAELVQRGYAQAFSYPPDVRYQGRLLRAQTTAREAERGLWGPTPTPAQPKETPTAAEPGGVQITGITYDGQVDSAESDEYAVIENLGQAPVDLGGWRLNAGSPGHDFRFPGFVLQPGQACRVYTDEYHPESCGFSFGSGQPVWNNGGDCGYLVDANGAEVSRYCY